MSAQRLLLILASFVLFGCVLHARADSIIPDPNLDVSDPLCSPITHPDPTTCPGATAKGQQISFQVKPDGGGIFVFTNIDPDPADAWRTLLISETGIPDNAITCDFPDNNAFVNCHAFGSDPLDPHNPLKPTFILYDDNGCPQCFGITFREEITINLNNTDPTTGLPSTSGDTGNWNPGQTITGTIIPNAPEPGSLVLLGSGALALLARRRK